MDIVKGELNHICCKNIEYYKLISNLTNKMINEDIKYDVIIINDLGILEDQINELSKKYITNCICERLLTIEEMELKQRFLDSITDLLHGYNNERDISFEFDYDRLINEKDVFKLLKFKPTLTGVKALDLMTFTKMHNAIYKNSIVIVENMGLHLGSDEVLELERELKNKKYTLISIDRSAEICYNDIRNYFYVDSNLKNNYFEIIKLNTFNEITNAQFIFMNEIFSSDKFKGLSLDTVISYLKEFQR